MPNDDIPGVTRLNTPRNIFNIPAPELQELVKEARTLLDRGKSAGYNRKQEAGLAGEYKSLRKYLKQAPPGSQFVTIPKRKNGVAILDAVIFKPDGGVIVLEAKYKSRGGRIRYAKTRNWRYSVAEDGTRVRTRAGAGKGTKQLSGPWIKDKIFELEARAAQLSGDEARDARALAQRLRNSLNDGSLEAVGVVVNKRGHVVFEDVRTNQIYAEIGDAADRYQALPEADRGAADRFRGTADRGGVDPPPRNSGGGTRPPAGTPDGTARLGPERAPAPDAPDSGSALRGAAPDGAPVRATPKPTSRGARLKARFKAVKWKPSSFTGNILLDVAKAVLFGVLQGKLARVNQEMIAASYNRQVFRPHILPIVEALIPLATTRAWYDEFPEDRKNWVYLRHEYTVEMNEEANTAADAIVIIFSGFEVPETFAALRPSQSPIYPLRSPRPLKTTHSVGKRTKTGRHNVVSYLNTRAQLVHSPVSQYMYQELQEIRAKALDRLAAFVGKLERDGHDIWAGKPADFLAQAINSYEFFRAYRMLELAGKGPLSQYSTEITAMMIFIQLADLKMTKFTRYGREEEALLATWLGTDPFEARRKFDKEEEKRLLEERFGRWPLRR